jgi:oxygen-dependent protoporphyrinogen oxidase
VGGGISGLVAAYRIRGAVGPEPTILMFDPADRLGGVLRTETLCDQPYDIGAEAFIARRPEVPRLLAELGLTDRQIVPTGVKTTIYSQGRLHPLPGGTLNGIPGSPDSMIGLVDASTVARIAGEPHRPLHWQPGSDPAVGDVVAPRFGEQVITRSLDPMLSGVYAGSAATIGIRSAAPTLAAALDEGVPNLTAAVRAALAPGGSGGPVFGAIAGGYRVLVDTLAARSGLQWQPTAITRLQGADGGWELTDTTGAGWRADAVVLALPAPRAAELLATAVPQAAAMAAGVPVASAAVLAMGLPAGTPFPPQSGVLVATGESLHAKAITLSSRKWGSRGGAELVRMSFGRFGDDIARTTPESQLQAWAVEDLATVFGIAAQPIDIKVHRWIDAMPQYGPGHRSLVADLRAALPPTLALAGNYLDGVGVPGCLAAAGRAAISVVVATSG